jgi:hypothetical protein
VASCVTARCCRVCRYEQTSLKMEVVLWHVPTYQRTWRHTTEDHTMKLYNCEDLRCPYFVEIISSHVFLGPGIFHIHGLETGNTADSVDHPLVVACFICGKSACIQMFEFPCNVRGDRDHSESICTTLCLCTGTIDGYVLQKLHYEVLSCVI